MVLGLVYFLYAITTPPFKDLSAPSRVFTRSSALSAPYPKIRPELNFKLPLFVYKLTAMPLFAGLSGSAPVTISPPSIITSPSELIAVFFFL